MPLPICANSLDLSVGEGEGEGLTDNTIVGRITPALARWLNAVTCNEFAQFDTN